MNKTTIDWPGLTHTWNPVTGCKRGCLYCYAKGIWDHWYRKRYNAEYSEILFHEDRLKKAPPKKAKRVFVGSMSDLEYWPRAWLLDVLGYCADNPEVEFMFLTKSAQAYCTICDWLIRWPVNTMQGITIERFDNTDNIASVYETYMICPRPFVSWEPMLGPANYPFPSGISLVIVGAMTGHGAVPVKQKWIDSVKRHVNEHTLYFKGELKRYV